MFGINLNNYLEDDMTTYTFYFEYLDQFNTGNFQKHNSSSYSWGGKNK